MGNLASGGADCPLKAPDAAVKVSPVGERRVLALLPEERAGRISTRNAGAVWFQATLNWRPGEEMPAGPFLGVPTPEAKFCSLARTDDASSATCRISCEIRAFCAEELTDALDGTLRSVTAYAGFTEAMLETRAVRLADPSVSPSTLVEKLARQLWSANLPVSFGSSWTPIAGADISVGTRAFEDAFETFLRAHSVWQPPLRSG